MYAPTNLRSYQTDSHKILAVFFSTLSALEKQSGDILIGSRDIKVF